MQPFIEQEAVDTSIRELKGKVASPGMAVGKTKVVLSRDDFRKLRAGDILVVAGTTPAYTIIMDKAAAIVADLGSIGSHTAKVSREMGIPCLIGTRIGTKVLKDNELVEVDVLAGIVRRL